MKARKPNKIRTSIRQKLSARIVIAAGVSLAALSAGIFFYLQLTKTEQSKASANQIIIEGNLPVDLVVDQLVITPVDTLMRQGNRYKVAKPLTLTPTLTK